MSVPLAPRRGNRTPTPQEGGGRPALHLGARSHCRSRFPDLLGGPAAPDPARIPRGNPQGTWALARNNDTPGARKPFSGHGEPASGLSVCANPCQNSLAWRDPARLDAEPSGRGLKRTGAPSAQRNSMTRTRQERTHFAGGEDDDQAADARMGHIRRPSPGGRSVRPRSP